MITHSKFVRYHFGLKNNEQLALTYMLPNSSIRDRWITHTKQRLTEDDHEYNLKIQNYSYKNIPELLEKLNTLVQSINRAYYKTLPEFTNFSRVDNDTLNYLHEEFELYGEHQDHDYVCRAPDLRDQLHRDFLDLNEYIHYTEDALLNTRYNFPMNSAIVQVYPSIRTDLSVPVQEIDKLFLTTDFKWGHLYLGYNTLGKDYMNACKDRDIRAVENDQIRVQKYFSSEAWLCFNRQSTLSKHAELEIYNWYLEQDEATKKLIPIADLNSIAMGRYYLGMLVIEYAHTSFCSDATRWYYDERLQRQWNLDVFSQITECRAVEFFDEYPGEIINGKTI